MKKLLTLILILFIQLTNAQDAPIKIYNTTDLKKGFYKTYLEYLNNNPSITEDFKTTYLTVSGTNKTIIEADYNLIDESKKTGKIWGFCDGKDVFIRFTTRLGYGKFWKVGYNGVMPFFYYNQSQTHAFGTGLMMLVTLAATATIDPELQMYFKRPQGAFVRATKGSIKRMLAKEPLLKKEFLEKIATFEKDDEKQKKLSNKELDKLRFEIYKEYIVKCSKILEKKQY